MFSGFGLLIPIAHMIGVEILLSKAWLDHYDVFNIGLLLMMEYGRGPTWKTDFISQNMVTKV